MGLRFLYFLLLIAFQCAYPSNADTPRTESTTFVSEIQSLYAKGELGQLRLILENKLSALHERDNAHQKAAILSMLFELYRVTGDVNGLINVVNTITESPILSDAPLQQFFALAASAYMARFSWDSKNTKTQIETFLQNTAFYPPQNLSSLYRDITFLYADILIDAGQYAEADLVAHRAIIQAASETNISALQSYGALLELSEHYLLTGRIDRGRKLFELLLSRVGNFYWNHTPDVLHLLEIHLLSDLQNGRFDNYQQTTALLDELLVKLDAKHIGVRPDWLFNALTMWGVLATENQDRKGFKRVSQLFSLYFRDTSFFETGEAALKLLEYRLGFLSNDATTVALSPMTLNKSMPFNTYGYMDLIFSNYLSSNKKDDAALEHAYQSLIAARHTVIGKTPSALYPIQISYLHERSAAHVIDTVRETTNRGLLPSTARTHLVVESFNTLVRLASGNSSGATAVTDHTNSDLIKSSMRNRSLLRTQYESLIDKKIDILIQNISESKPDTNQISSDEIFKQERTNFFQATYFGNQLYRHDNVLRSRNPDYFSNTRLPQTTENAVRLLAGEHNAVLWLAFVNDQLVELCFDGKNYAIVETNVTKRSLNERIRTLRETLIAYGPMNPLPNSATRGFTTIQSSETNDSSFSAVSTSLYVDIFNPVAQCLHSKKKIVIHADPLFFSLPFNVLQKPLVGGRHDWFITHHAYELIPLFGTEQFYSRTFDKDLRPPSLLAFGDFLPHKTNPKSDSVEKTSFLSMRDGHGGLGELDALPETRAEILAIAEHFDSSLVSLHFEEAATEMAFRKARPERYSTLVFATHGIVSGEFDEFQEPGLVLTQGTADSTYDDGILTAGEVRSLDLDADLVILSACNTALSDGTPNSQGLGDLADAFLFSGSKAVIASQWPVETHVAPIITTHLSAHYRQSLDLGTSLQAAMLSILDNPALSQFHHPSYWAPFIPISAGHRAADVETKESSTKLHLNWETVSETSAYSEFLTVASSEDGSTFVAQGFKAIAKDPTSGARGILVQYDKEGHQRKVHDFPEYGPGLDVLFTDDGDIVSLWYQIPTTEQPNRNGIVIKSRLDGTVLWKTELSTPMHDSPHNIMQLDNGHFVVTTEGNDFSTLDQKSRSTKPTTNLGIWLLNNDGAIKATRFVEFTELITLGASIYLSTNATLLVPYSVHTGGQFAAHADPITADWPNCNPREPSTILVIDLSTESLPIIQKKTFVAGKIVDSENTGDETLVLVEKSHSCVLNGDIGVYKLNPTTFNLKEMFTFGGPEDERPKSLIIMDSGDLVVAGTVDNDKIYRFSNKYDENIRTDFAILETLFDPEDTFSSMLVVFSPNGDVVTDAMDFSPTGAGLGAAIKTGSNRFVIVGRGGDRGRRIAEYSVIASH